MKNLSKYMTAVLANLMKPARGEQIDLRPRVRRPKRSYNSASTVKLGKLVSVCKGGRHAWFESNVGLVRKPIQPEQVS